MRRGGLPGGRPDRLRIVVDAVEKALPSVVLSAKSAAGADLFDVTVTLDGQPLASKLDGQAVAVDPGPHTFRFAAADGTAKEQQVLVKEGEQSQPVNVVLGQPAASAARTDGAPAAGKSGGGPWRTVGWVVGGVGVAGLAIGSVFGVMAIGDHDNAACNSANQCKPGPLADARSAALAADIGLIAGGVLLAGGAGLVLFGPRGEPTPATTASLRIVPFVAKAGGGLSAGGVW